MSTKKLQILNNINNSIDQMLDPLRLPSSGGLMSGSLSRKDDHDQEKREKERQMAEEARKLKYRRYRAIREEKLSKVRERYGIEKKTVPISPSLNALDEVRYHYKMSDKEMKEVESKMRLMGLERLQLTSSKSCSSEADFEEEDEGVEAAEAEINMESDEWRRTMVKQMSIDALERFLIKKEKKKRHLKENCNIQ